LLARFIWTSGGAQVPRDEGFRNVLDLEADAVYLKAAVGRLEQCFVLLFQLKSFVSIEAWEVPYAACERS